MLKKKAIYIFWAVVYAIGVFYITVFIFNVAGGNVLVAAIWNMVYIIIFLIIERIDYFILKKIKSKDDNKKATIFKRILLAYLGSPSIKSALYFFYIGVTVVSAILAAEPDFPTLSNFSDYLLSVRYGIRC